MTNVEWAGAVLFLMGFLGSVSFPTRSRGNTLGLALMVLGLAVLIAGNYAVSMWA